MKAIRSTLQWEVLRAKILLVSGDQRGAKRALRRAVTTAAPRCYIRSLIDEGEVITELIKEIYLTESELQGKANSFIGQLLAATGTASAPQALTSSLKESVNAALDARERDVLKLVALGLLNREIGQRLGLTEGTVKWYLQRIFDKLGIRRRTQAVHRAKQFGLLA
jgi:LuxR family transcriptional regulator, maltose regulon positive regulatory protein